MKAPLGAVVSLYYDSPREVIAGNVLRTPGGRMYLLCEVRRQTRGKHVGRWYFKAVVIDQLPAGATVHPIYWYRRGRRSR